MGLYNRLKLFQKLERQQWLSGEQIYELQSGRLQQLICYAYEHVPYYRRLFNENGIDPAAIWNAGDLNKIPILTKQSFSKTITSDFISDNVDVAKCIKRVTSGSTGIQQTVYRNRKEVMYDDLTKARASFSNGVRPWHKRARIQAEHRIPQNKIGNTFSKIWQKVIFIPSAFKTEDQIAMLRDFQPNVIIGYSSALKLMMYTIKKKGISDIHPSIVMSFAEMLDEQTRALAREVFDVEIVDLYGAIETSCVAWECPKHDGYHLNTDIMVIEFLRDGDQAQAGEPGHIVVTPFYLTSMPLIRYDLGDVGVLSDRKCSCGRGSPLMEKLQGRTNDFITLPSGTIMIAAPILGHQIIGSEPCIAEYFIVQEDIGNIMVQLLIRGEDQLQIAERVKGKMEDAINHEAVVTIEVVDKIEKGPADKFRCVVSKVPVDF